MRFSLSLTAASVLALANAGVIQRDGAGLKVTLSAADASGAVVATVTNTGAVDMNLLTLGTFLDSAPVEKLDVINESSKHFFSSL
jgi:deuterolysin